MTLPPPRRTSALPLAVLAASCLAGVPAAAPPISPQVRGAPGHLEETQVTVIPLGPGDDCTDVYDNTTGFSGNYYADQDGAESIDDLHGVESGALCSYGFGYFQPAAGYFQATITFYANDGTDAPPSTIVAGPYVISGLPPGTNGVDVSVSGGPVIGSDLWMGVRFDDPEVGLLFSDPPGTGSSHDYFYENGDYYYFGGDPPANFYLSVTAQLSVPAAAVSWGEIKRRPAAPSLDRSHPRE